MAARSGFALKFLQWFFRSIQFGSAAVVFAIYSYFLATLSNHDLAINDQTRAVEVISGVAVLYTALGLVLLFCLAGHPLTSFIAIVLDVCLVFGFVYIAVVNRGGASSCRGTVDTVYGTGNSDTNIAGSNGNNGITVLPNLHTACMLETACLAASIVASFLFVFSALLEFALVRDRRKKKRLGPNPSNNYTHDYGKQQAASANPHGALKRTLTTFFGLGHKRRNTLASEDPNALPEHTHPSAMRESYAKQ